MNKDNKIRNLLYRLNNELTITKLEYLDNKIKEYNKIYNSNISMQYINDNIYYFNVMNYYDLNTNNELIIYLNNKLFNLNDYIIHDKENKEYRINNFLLDKIKLFNNTKNSLILKEINNILQKI